MSRVAPILGLLLSAHAFPLMAQSAPGGTIQVVADGAVGQPGSAAYPSDARLSTVAVAARVDPEAYILGAAWLQPALQRDQLRLRAGIVYELGAIRRQALAADNTALAGAGASFQAWISARPITGRRTGAALDPSRLEATPAEDWPVHEGDTLFYPRRPVGIRVVGAVEKACRLPHVPLQDARRYLAACPASAAADPDQIYIVQPDGAVFAQNIALWNRDAPRPLAPGAWIYVPFDRHAIAGAADETFNRDVADFIATQLLSDEGWR
ncbi:capsule biosynthesis GfcC family protein [Luteibacter yeojuensis]